MNKWLIRHLTINQVYAITFFLLAANIANISYGLWYTGRQEARIRVLQEEVVDWEQISENWRRTASTYALSSDRCLQTVRTYQRMVFQPEGMTR